MHDNLLAFTSASMLVAFSVAVRSHMLKLKSVPINQKMYNIECSDYRLILSFAGNTFSRVLMHVFAGIDAEIFVYK